MGFVQRLTLRSAVAIVCTASGCSLVEGLDQFRTCNGVECLDSGVPAACRVTGTACADSSGCSAPTPVCSNGICVGIKSLAHGQADHECALLKDCTLRCWGDNTSGELGTGDFSQPTTPQVVKGIDNVLDVGVGLGGGNGYTCALRHDQTVWCWGDNSVGALGTGTLGANLATPTPVAFGNGVQVNALTVGENAACATLADATVWCWGSNSRGAIVSGASDGGNDPILTPTQLPLKSHAVGAVAVAGDATCVVHDLYVVDCFGNNLFGIFGTGTASDQPNQIGTTQLGTAPIEQLVGGEVQMCARQRVGTNNGEVPFCWGGNYYGTAIADEQASGQTITSPTPLDTVTKLGSVNSIEPSYRHSCALIASGNVYCWGQNDHGQVGVPADATKAYFPTQVTDQSQNPIVASEIAAHRQFACAVVQGDVQCWGDNVGYQLGNGTTVDAYQAASVSW